MEKPEKIYVGLDLGTDSAGWAVTDQNYKIIKAKGHSLWGTRLFPEAQTAKGRRMLRTSRRREERRRQRVLLLQGLFKDEIAKEDPEFFIRLNESSLHLEDKTQKCKYSLFNDKGFSDADYYKQYPTIYHLRQALVLEDHKFDIRLVYLALHHLIKYRGNFLMEGQNLSNKGQDEDNYIKSLFDQLESFYQQREETSSFSLKVSDFKKFGDDVVCAMGINATAKAIFEDIVSNNDGLTKVIAKALAGGKVKGSALLPTEDEADPEEESFSMADEAFEDEALPELQVRFESESSFFVLLQSIFNWVRFKKILKGEKYLCTAMVQRFKKYGDDLRSLREFSRRHLSKGQYKELFILPGTKDRTNFSAYTKGSLVNGKKLYSKGCSYEDFKKFLFLEGKSKNGLFTSLIKEHPEIASDPEYLHIKEGFDNNEFLRKSNNPENGSLPYQLNEIELEEILVKQGKYYPFLSEKDGKFTTAEKIHLLLTFRIPYYVGPLNTHQPDGINNHGWAVRKAEGKITPWNFHEMIDENQSEDKFIGRMTNKCNYLPWEDVLPSQSLTYQEYLVLNELNNLQINGEKMSPELKNSIFDNVYKNNSKVTLKKIKEFILLQGAVKSGKEIELTGLDGEPKAALSSYCFFKKVLGKIEYDDVPMIEEIIKWLTISEDKNRVAVRIKSNFKYRKRLTDVQIKEISAFSCKGWGSFSMALLKGKDIGWTDPVLGTWNTVLDLMHQTQLNFMSLYFSEKYGIKEQVDKLNSELTVADGKVSYEDIEELNVSPLVKRPINQAFRIVNEVTKAVGKDPDKIFVEVTRENQDNKKTPDSRKNRLIELYKTIKADTEEFNNLNNDLIACPNQKLKSLKVFLYFMQMGRCLYTGTKVNFEDLSSDAYDIDHIYPQSLIKDDGISNRALVIKDSNARKSDEYPIKPEIQSQNRNFWKMLHEKGFMDDEKYARLTRVTELTDDEINSFVKRQLVTTSQSVNGLIQILHDRFPKATIYWSKASHASDFRKKFKFIKSRTVNDFHHAHDAYLNIVAGNIFQSKYSFINGHMQAGYAARHRIDKNFVINPEDIFNNSIPGAWNVKDGEKDIDTVKQMMSRNDILFTQMPFENKGAFYDMKLSPKGEDKNYGRITEIGPKADIGKYGGYDNVSTAYFFLVESEDKKGRKIKSIESMPIMYAERFARDKEFAHKLLSDYFKLKNPKIIRSKLLIQSELQVGKSRIIIRGKTGDSLVYTHCMQWFVSPKVLSYIHVLDKYKNDLMKAKAFDFTKTLDPSIQTWEINENTNKKDEQKFILSKDMNLYIYDEVVKQLNKDIFNGVSFGNTLPGLVKGREKFATLDLKSQAIVLFQMFNLLHCDATTADLKIVGLGSHMGKFGISKYLPDNGSIKLVDQSITGIYCKIQEI